MPAGVHAGCSSLVLCLIWLCILSGVSDKNLKLAAIRVNTNIFVILNSIEMGKKKKTKRGKPHRETTFSPSCKDLGDSYLVTLICVKPPYMVLKYRKYGLKSVKG